MRELQQLLAGLRADDRPASAARESAETREQLRSLGYLAGTTLVFLGIGAFSFRWRAE